MYKTFSTPCVFTNGGGKEVVGRSQRYIGEQLRQVAGAKVLYRYEGSVFVACTNGVGMQMRPRCFDVKDASLLKEGEYTFLHAHSVFCRWWYSTAIQQSSELLNTAPDSGVLARAVMA